MTSKTVKIWLMQSSNKLESTDGRIAALLSAADLVSIVTVC